MARLLGTITIIAALILFPPASLALISNNAVPGDATYPIKRLLEDGIFAVASLNPITKAWFSAARSDRRFEELSTLIAQGKSASNTLDELVVQTDIAAEEIKKVEDPVKKQELIAQLSQSIDKYSEKLDEVSSSQIAIITPTNTPQPVVIQPSSEVTPQPRETVRPTPVSITSQKTAAPTAKPISTPRPTELPRPSPSQISPPTSQQPPSATPSINLGEADDAKEKLEDIKDKLDKEVKKSHQEKREDKREDRQDERSEKDKEKRNKDSDHDKKRD